MRSTNRSLAFEDCQPRKTAEAVTLAVEAGLILVDKANLTVGRLPNCHSGFTCNPHGGFDIKCKLPNCPTRRTITTCKSTKFRQYGVLDNPRPKRRTHRSTANPGWLRRSLSATLSPHTRRPHDCHYPSFDGSCLVFQGSILPPRRHNGQKATPTNVPTLYQLQRPFEVQGDQRLSQYPGLPDQLGHRALSRMSRLKQLSL